MGITVVEARDMAGEDKEERWLAPPELGECILLSAGYDGSAAKAYVKLYGAEGLPLVRQHWAPPLPNIQAYTTGAGGGAQGGGPQGLRGPGGGGEIRRPIGQKHQGHQGQGPRPPEYRRRGWEPPSHPGGELGEPDTLLLLLYIRLGPGAWDALPCGGGRAGPRRLERLGGAIHHPRLLRGEAEG